MLCKQNLNNYVDSCRLILIQSVSSSLSLPVSGLWFSSFVRCNRFGLVRRPLWLIGSCSCICPFSAYKTSRIDNKLQAQSSEPYWEKLCWSEWKICNANAVPYICCSSLHLQTYTDRIGSASAVVVAATFLFVCLLVVFISSSSFFTVRYRQLRCIHRHAHTCACVCAPYLFRWLHSVRQDIVARDDIWDEVSLRFFVSFNNWRSRTIITSCSPFRRNLFRLTNCLSFPQVFCVFAPARIYKSSRNENENIPLCMRKFMVRQRNSFIFCSSRFGHELQRTTAPNSFHIR